MKQDHSIGSAAGLRWLAGLTAVLTAVAACATGEVAFEGSGGSGGTTGVTTTTSGNGGSGGAVGGSGGSGGSGGDPFPCGIDCTTIETPDCKEAVCNLDVLQCEVVDQVDGTTCDDELFCTVNDSCVAGSCEGGPQNDCGLMVPDCQDVVCDEAALSCSTVSSTDGTACTTADLCETNTVCTNGLCAGQPKDCFFSPVPNECHVSACNPMTGMCEPEFGNFGLDCADATDMCTVNKTCDMMGQCVGGQPMDCSGLTQGCFNGVCNVNNGQCEQVPVAPGGSCLDAVDDCNVGVCDMNGLCQPVPANEGGVCEDGNTCTSGETCTAGTCSGGVSVTQVIYFEEDFADNVAGWTMDGEWQIGPAMVSSGHTSSCGNADPGQDHTVSPDNGVAGVNIGGNAATTPIHPMEWITSPPFDTSTVPGSLWLGYYRYLNSDYTNFMNNKVEVFDGTAWVELWQSGPSPGIKDAAWGQHSHDLTPYKNANMQIRFGMEVGSSGVYTCSSWNLDDVTVANVICP